MIGYLSKFIPRYTLLTAPLRKQTYKDTQFKWGQEENSAFGKLKDSITNESTMAFFNPMKPIVLRCEASFNEGLSAGLFQQTEKGLQPVHYISRSMSDTEKRYSQTEKDALSIRWAKNRFSMYLLGAPKFKIITAHKPLIPLFNKTTIKLPPRIEKWVMDMQDVDFELLYEPGKDAADPLDFLSRHPLPEKENDGTEKVIKAIIHNEHAVMLKQLQEETKKDKQLLKLKVRILKCDWERNKKDVDIIPFYHIRNELFVAEGLVFRLNQIIVPKTLQDKVINTAHNMGHFGMTKTKQMLREKYWFPTMNSMIEETIKRCFECQITTKQQTKEPLKMTEIPEIPWEVVSVDFGGPYPDGHYNLVVIDKRTRYPDVEKLNTTACKQTKEKLMKIFSTHGIPRRLESDNGPPFNSVEFANFATEQGFEHHKITPLHPRANGEAEAFMKVLNKTEQIAKLQNKDSATAVQEMLIGYRSTPHPATGVSPYEALMKRQIRTKLGYLQRTNDDREMIDDQKINERDKHYKNKIKYQAENRNTREHNFKIGDYVLVVQTKRDKWTTVYEPAFYIVFRINGSTINARRVTDGREICRDASKFKLANQLVKEDEYGPPARQVREGAEDEESNGPPARHAREGVDWRERLLRQTEAKSRINNGQDINQCDNRQLQNVRPRREHRVPERFKDFLMQ